ncbi:MAG: hypothetical protein C5B49_15915 [Bdellovibrio sp.]|nr:MAG: hypothetical protein C5B49_15915 [Bdellovibrio sp.]
MLTAVSFAVISLFPLSVPAKSCHEIHSAAPKGRLMKFEINLPIEEWSSERLKPIEKMLEVRIRVPRRHLSEKTATVVVQRPTERAAGGSRKGEKRLSSLRSRKRRVDPRFIGWRNSGFRIGFVSPEFLRKAKDFAKQDGKVIEKFYAKHLVFAVGILDGFPASLEDPKLIVIQGSPPLMAMSVHQLSEIRKMPESSEPQQEAEDDLLHQDHISFLTDCPYGRYPSFAWSRDGYMNFLAKQESWAVVTKYQRPYFVVISEAFFRSRSTDQILDDLGFSANLTFRARLEAQLDEYRQQYESIEQIFPVDRNFARTLARLEAEGKIGIFGDPARESVGGHKSARVVLIPVNLPTTPLDSDDQVNHDVGLTEKE